jgi:hypothetical protein
MTAQIDHIVLLVSTPFFQNPAEWLSGNFTIQDGGRHTGQASRNNLICFADGTYLELFNWYDKPPPPDDENQPMRVWGAKPEGLIDFALTSTSVPAEECIKTVNARLKEPPERNSGLGVEYQDPVPGGRKRADGVDVKWKVSRPVFGLGDRVPAQELFPGGRLDCPFFCHDVTERSLRVDSGDESKTTHPCGATGIAACEILVPSELLSEYATLYSKILGSNPEIQPDNGCGKSFSLDVGVPNDTKTAKVVVREAHSERDLMRVRERGIGVSDLVLNTTAKVEGGKQSLGHEGMESTIWLQSTRGS